MACEMETKILTTDCGEYCDNHDACIFRDGIWTDGGESNDCEEADNSSSNEGCWRSDSESNCRVQCMNIFGSDESATLVILSHPTENGTEVKHPSIKAEHVDKIDVRVPDHVREWRICGDDCDVAKDADTKYIEITSKTMSSPTELKALTLYGLNLSSPPDLNALPSPLKNATINISFCHLSSIPEGDYLYGVETLDLSHNDLQDLPDDLELNEAINIHLQENRLDKIPQAIAATEYLHLLNLSGNPLENRILGYSMLSSLEYVNVSLPTPWLDNAYECPEGSLNAILGTEYYACSPNGLSGGKIAAIIVPIVAFVAIIGGCVYYRCRAKSWNKYHRYEDGSASDSPIVHAREAYENRPQEREV